MDIRIYISPKLDVDADSLTVGFIGDSGNSVNLLCLYEFRDLFNESRLIYKVWELRDDDMALSVRSCLDVCHRADSDLPAACAVRFFDSSRS